MGFSMNEAASGRGIGAETTGRATACPGRSDCELTMSRTIVSRTGDQELARTISISTVRASSVFFISRGNAIRRPCTRSPVFRRTWKPRRSTAVIDASSGASPASCAAMRRRASPWSRIHVLDDSGRNNGQRIRRRRAYSSAGNPAHDTEPADEVNAFDLDPVVGKVGVVLPVSCVLIARQIELAHLVGGRLRRHYR